MGGYKKDSTNAFLAYFFYNQVLLCEEVLRIVCTPINNGGGVKNPLSYPVLRLTPSFWMFLWIIVIRKKCSI